MKEPTPAIQVKDAKSQNVVRARRIKDIFQRDVVRTMLTSFPQASSNLFGFPCTLERFVEQVRDENMDRQQEKMSAEIEQTGRGTA